MLLTFVLLQTGVELSNVKMSVNPFCEIALEVQMTGSKVLQ